VAGFHTHITASTAVGVGYGLVGHLNYGMSPSASVLAGGICSVAGILPDVDSDSGHTVREITGFTAAVVPLLLLDRLQRTMVNSESVVLAGACIYIIIRFGLFELLRRYTVHRGMWHSVPAALMAGLVVALICSGQPTDQRLFKVGAVVLGYLTHLALDELWSLQDRRGRIRVKRSFGTALKFWSNNRWANFSTYAKLVLLIGLALNDPSLKPYLASPTQSMRRLSDGVLRRVRGEMRDAPREIW
jgi:membrane-bound metal-dependent hydrolase YbcI (DUF457 family)